MGVVIRPATGVFRRSLPLTVVFGAYRPIDSAEALSMEEATLVTRCVQLSRQMRAPLAFIIPIESDGSSPVGTWLPDCRPKVKDRVFRVGQTSAFENAEFRGACLSLAGTTLVLAGPSSDSSLVKTSDDAAARMKHVRVVQARKAVRNCSTIRTVDPRTAAQIPQTDRFRSLSLTQWENTICVLE